MSSEKITFNKENLDMYLKEVAKEFRRLNGKKMHAEIVLVGGAAVLINYNFRDMTTDMDAIIRASSAMKEAINKIGDKFDLPNRWINDDFVQTTSYSYKLIEVSTYYKTFSNVLEVRTVASEYLIAMKLKSARKYKSDLSDVIGILNEHNNRGDRITFERINQAMYVLYNGWDNISDEIKRYIQELTNQGIDYERYYLDKKKEESAANETLIIFNKDYPDILSEDNTDDILTQMKKKFEREKLKEPTGSFFGGEERL